MLDSRLKHDRWLAKLPSEAREAIVKSMSVRRYSANEAIYLKGDDAIGLYGLLSGRVRVSAVTHEGEELVFTTLMQGKWFGEISILDGQNRTHDMYALEDSDVAVLPIDKLTQLMAIHPSIHQALVVMLCEHCRMAFAAIDDFLLCSPKQRLAKRMVSLEFSSPEPIKASQEELSQLVGISRQSVSKFLKEWEEEGVIERRYGFIRVLQRDALRAVTA